MPSVLTVILLLLAVANLGGVLFLLLRRQNSAAAVDLAPVEARFQRLETTLREESERARREGASAAADSRTELSRSITGLGEFLAARQKDATDAQARSLETLTANLTAALTALRGDLETSRKTLAEALEAGRKSQGETLDATRKSLGDSLELFRDSLTRNFSAFGSEQTSRFNAADARLAENFAALRTTVETSLNAIRTDNEQRLEKMRQTVDEKLQSTLEHRLGESFKLVSERLESVQKGLGEMQALASGVGDLKRVLTNVKTRGTWGEVLLGNLLEQVFSPDQYAANVATTGSSARVEYAIKLPGRGEGEDSDTVWLPIDSKFPKEDYERLILAQEAADPDGALLAGNSLEISIKRFAQDICSKYIESPKTTDFAILFLPSEGLFAEVIRRTELTEHLHFKCKVLVCGPTTLAAFLNSLQMGFRTLAIQKRSSEVWDLLGAVKTEFSKYGELMASVKKQLETAVNTIEKTEVRTRQINRKLKSVEQLDTQKTEEIFPANLLEDDA